jgi:hypothetical protein
MADLLSALLLVSASFGVIAASVDPKTTFPVRVCEKSLGY